MGKTVKVGVIGTGIIGKGHIKKYKNMSDDVELVAVCDLNEEEAKRVAKEFDVPNVFKNFRDPLAMDEIEAVDVCLHNNLHAPVGIAAMEAGKHVYCEKPLAGSVADAQAMLDARERTGKQLSMQCASLFSPGNKAAKRLIDDGHLGKIYYAKASHYRRRGRCWVDGIVTANFVQKEVSAGGALYDMGIYQIVAMLHLLGNPEVLTISGGTHQEIPMYEHLRKSGGYNVEEFGLAYVRLAGGISLFIEEAWALHLGSTDGSKVAGSTGGITLDPFQYHTTLSDMEMNADVDVHSANRRWGTCIEDFDSSSNSQEHWVAVLQEKTPLLDSAKLGVSMMTIAEGIYMSQELGREVTADEVRKASKSTAIKNL